MLGYGLGTAPEYYSAKYQIPYRMLQKRQNILPCRTVPYPSAGEKELNTAYPNAEKSTYRTVPHRTALFYRYAEYRFPTRYRGNHFPYDIRVLFIRLFMFEILLPRTPLKRSGLCDCPTAPTSVGQLYVLRFHICRPTIYRFHHWKRRTPQLQNSKVFIYRYLDASQQISLLPSK